VVDPRKNLSYIVNDLISVPEGIQTQFDLRKNEGLPACKKVFDAEDSFPTGAIRKTGRLFCRPDLINVQKLDGILYDVKYLIIARNVTVSRLHSF
jgi:cupin superfamily acireductone dioxygenase involved in methionine salvage